MKLIIDITLILVTLSFLVNISLVTLVLYKSNNNFIKIHYAILIFLISLWALISAISLRPIGQELQLLFCRLDLFLGIMGTIAFINFSSRLLDNSFKYFKTILLISGIFWGYTILFSNLVVFKIEPTEVGFVFYPGVLDIFYVFNLIIFIIIGIALLYKAYYQSPLENKLQYQYLLLSSFIPGTIIITSVLVLERLSIYIDASSDITKVILPATGYLSILIFTVITSYALVKNRLFGIRILLSRIMYWILLILLLTFILMIYGYLVSNIKLFEFYIIFFSSISALLIVLFIGTLWPILQKKIINNFIEDEEIIKEFNLDLIDKYDFTSLSRSLFSTIEKIFKPTQQLLIVYEPKDDPKLKIANMNFTKLEIDSLMNESTFNKLINLPKDISDITKEPSINSINVKIDYLLKTCNDKIGVIYLIGNKFNNQRYLQSELHLMNQLIFYVTLNLQRQVS